MAVSCRGPINGKRIGGLAKPVRSKRCRPRRSTLPGQKHGSSWPSELATRSRTTTWRQSCSPAGPGRSASTSTTCAGRPDSAPVLGKLVTLDEYFRVSREPDDWTTFNPREYPSRATAESGVNAISSQVDAYRSGVHDDTSAAWRRVGGDRWIEADRCRLTIPLARWSSSILGTSPARSLSASIHWISRPISSSSNTAKLAASYSARRAGLRICGAASRRLRRRIVALVEDRTLRNERFELTVSKKTGGIQSLRTTPRSQHASFAAARVSSRKRRPSSRFANGGRSSRSLAQRRADRRNHVQRANCLMHRTRSAGPIHAARARRARPAAGDRRCRA